MPIISPAEIVIFIFFSLTIVCFLIFIYLYIKVSSENSKLKQSIIESNSNLENLKQSLSYQSIVSEKNDVNLLSSQNYDVLPVCIIESDTHDFVTYINHNAGELLEIDKANALNKPINELFQISDENGSQIPLKTIIGNNQDFLFVYLASKDKHIPIFIKTGFRDTEIDKFTIITFIKAEMYLNLLNISRQEVQKNESFQASESFAMTFIDNLNICIIVTDENDLVTYINPETERLIGKGKADVADKKLSDVVLLTDDKDNALFQSRESLKTHHLINIPKWTFLSIRAGEKIPINGSIINITLLSGKQNTILYFQDATSIYSEEREEKAFFSAAAHDLRTPLANIRGVIEIFSEQFTSIDKENAKLMLKGASEATMYLITLVNDLLNVLRIDQGRVDIKKEAFDIIELTKSIVEGMSFTARSKHLFLTHEVTDLGLPKVIADKTKTHEILTNLISNAIKYTPQGGVTISHELVGPILITHVRDTGTGINREHQQLLFKKFQQIGNARSQPLSKSTGLGLYISKKFALLMNGDVTLNFSEPQKGSDFILKLPIAYEDKITQN
jgi:PAS domain S-box-containing protein